VDLRIPSTRNGLVEGSATAIAPSSLGPRSGPPTWRINVFAATDGLILRQIWLSEFGYPRDLRRHPTRCLFARVIALKRQLFRLNLDNAVDRRRRSSTLIKFTSTGWTATSISSLARTERAENARWKHFSSRHSRPAERTHSADGLLFEIGQ